MIAGYCRVSTADQASDDKTSLATQRQKIIGCAMMRGVGEASVAVYEDAGVSGAIPLSERPSGERMLAALKADDIIIASKLDRLFRSASDALVTVENLHRRGIGVILADIGSEVVTENGTAKLFFSMLAAFAEFDKFRSLERMNDGKEGKRARNGHVGGQAPYGFSVQGKGRDSILVEHESEQRVVSLMVDLRTNGNRPLHVIATELERRGIVNRVGRKFNPNQVKRIVDRHAPRLAAE